MKARRVLRSYYIFLRDFLDDLFDDKIGHYASSLSWSTLFAIIPLMVIMLWVFTNLPIFDSVFVKIEHLIFTNLMPANSKEVMAYVNTFLSNVDKLGYMGIAYVVIAAFFFFRNYDYIVNDIFEAPTRSFLKGLKTYMLFLLIVPILLGSSFYLSAVIQSYLDKSSITGMIHLYYFLPFAIIWGVFYLAFQFSANTRISVSSAVISSFITSLTWYLSKSAFVQYVLYNKTYTSIYGGISTLLFFFLWIYISWAIFLHGLKFCDLLERDEEIEKI